MKTFAELCGIFKRIAKNPEETVDYLTVLDYLQMRQHLDVCEACEKLRKSTVDEYYQKNPTDVNFGDASEN